MTAPSVTLLPCGCTAEGPWNDDGDYNRAATQWNTRATPTPSELRERVARIIDPDAFSREWKPLSGKVDRNMALAKADAIIPLLPSEAAIRADEREKRLPLKSDDVEWIVNDIAELGVKIGEQFFFLYKGRSLVYGTDEISSANGVALNEDADPPTQHMWRHVFKREFGECAHPINYTDPTKIGTVSLDDSDDWKPLPAAIRSAGGEK